MKSKLKKQLTELAINKKCNQLVYISEWLGYLPYGLYHWLEMNGEDISLTLCEWTNKDLEELVLEGFLLEVSKELREDEPEYEKVTYLIECINEAESPKK
jgi:hypothetical protein